MKAGFEIFVACVLLLSVSVIGVLAQDLTSCMDKMFKCEVNAIVTSNVTSSRIKEMEANVLDKEAKDKICRYTGSLLTCYREIKESCSGVTIFSSARYLHSQNYDEKCGCASLIASTALVAIASFVLNFSRKFAL